MESELTQFNLARVYNVVVGLDEPDEFDGLCVFDLFAIYRDLWVQYRCIQDSEVTYKYLLGEVDKEIEYLDGYTYFEIRDAILRLRDMITTGQKWEHDWDAVPYSSQLNYSSSTNTVTKTEWGDFLDKLSWSTTGQPNTRNPPKKITFWP